MSEYVIVTTSHRGVFAGLLQSYNPLQKTATLREARYGYGDAGRGA